MLALAAEEIDEAALDRLLAALDKLLTALLAVGTAVGRLVTPTALQTLFAKAIVSARPWVSHCSRTQYASCCSRAVFEHIHVTLDASQPPV